MSDQLSGRGASVPSLWVIVVRRHLRLGWLDMGNKFHPGALGQRVHSIVCFFEHIL